MPPTFTTVDNVAFDFGTRIINVPANVAAIDAQWLVDHCRLAEESSVGVARPGIVEGSGKVTIDVDINGNPIRTGVVAILKGWKIATLRSTGSFTIKDVYSADNSIPYVEPAPVPIRYQQTVGGVLLQGGGSGGGVTLAEIEASTVLAKEATVASRANQASVNAIPAAIWSNTTRTLTEAAGLTSEQANQLFNLHSRLSEVRATNLDNLDATISSRLGAIAYSSPPTTNAITTAVWSNSTRTLTTSAGGATLAEIEASTVLAKESTVASRASQTSVSLIPTNPLLTTDTRLDNLDTPISSRFAAANYTTPPTVSAIAFAVESQLSDDFSFIATSLAPVGTELARLTALLEPTGTGGERFRSTALSQTPVDPRLANLDATVSSRLAASSYTTPPTTSAISTAIWSATERSLTVSAGLSPEQATQLGNLHQRLTDLRASNLDNLNATVSSRLAASSYIAPASTDAIALAVESQLLNDFASVSAQIASIPVPPSAADLLAVRTSVDELCLIHGLKIGFPLIVTNTSRTVGELKQTIKETPTQTTVTRI